MITCVVDYTIDPAKLDAFEAFAQAWMRLVERVVGVFVGFCLAWAWLVFLIVILIGAS